MSIEKNVEFLKNCNFDELTARLNIRETSDGRVVQYLFFAADPNSGEILDIDPKCKIYEEDTVVSLLAVLRSSLIDEKPPTIELAEPEEVPESIRSILIDSLNSFNK